MRKNTLITVLLLVGLLVLAPWAQAQGIPMLNVSNAKGGQQYSLTLQLLALMTTLTLLPSMLLMMTSNVVGDILDAAAGEILVMTGA
jgi:flagellar biosynthetic protein FliP